MSLDLLTVQPAPVPREAFTLEEFCIAHRLSRAMIYKMWTIGEGPRKMQVGAKVLITREAAADWRRAREAATNARTSTNVEVA